MQGVLLIDKVMLLQAETLEGWECSLLYGFSKLYRFDVVPVCYSNRHERTAQLSQRTVHKSDSSLN